jgi:glycosyltransferase involved in cell wall biosynthesis
MFKPKAVYIVDPGLIEAGGHYHTQDLSIARECQKRDIPVTIYCRCGANLGASEISVAEIFRFDVFIERPPENPDFCVFENYFVVNRAFLQDLNLIPTENFSPDDLVYFPGLTQNQIEAVADWVTSIPASKRPHIAITLRFLNSRMHYNLNRGFAPAIEFLYRHVLAKLLERHPKTHLYSDTLVLSRSYNGMSGIPVITLPIPQLEFHPEFVRKSPPNKTELNILHIGNVSPYRGYNFIPSIIESVLSEFPNVRFTVQVKTDPESEAARTMVAIPESYASCVQFLFGTLSPDEYVNTMQAADIVLLPYMPSYYSFGSSGVFTEAAAMGKVLVVTAGTTMETTITSFDLGAVIAPEYTAEAFAAALKAAVGNFIALEQKADASYIRFSHENSPEGFLDRMFSCIG